MPRLWSRFRDGVRQSIPARKLDRLLWIPPARRGRQAEGPPRARARLRAARRIGIGPLAAEVLAWYRRLGLDLVEGYAQTENFCYSHLGRPGQVRAGVGGVPLPGMECRLAADGEIEVKSPGTMLGYFQDERRTAETFTRDGFLRTRDLGEQDADGWLRVAGRMKDPFETAGGEYVSPGPIEDRLLESASLDQSCVCGAGRAHPYAVAVLAEEARRRVEKEGREDVERELLEHLEAGNRHLPPLERVEFLAVVGDRWLPENDFLTPTLKVRRRAIEAAYAPLAPSWEAEGRAVVWGT